MRLIPAIFTLLLASLTILRADPFTAAHTLEQQGNYAAAATAYEEIIRTAGASAATLLNQGNCYAREHHYGKAILAYERALLLAPRAADIRKNLTLVRKSAFPHEAFTLSASPWHYLSRSEWTTLIATSALLLGACSISLWLLPRCRKPAIIASVVAVLLITLSIIALQQRRLESAHAIVTGSHAQLLLSPFSSAAQITPCAAGTRVQFIRAQGDFRYVTLLPTTTSGWLHQGDLALIELPPTSVPPQL